MLLYCKATAKTQEGELSRPASSGVDSRGMVQTPMVAQVLWATPSTHPTPASALVSLLPSLAGFAFIPPQVRNGGGGVEPPAVSESLSCGGKGVAS